MKIIFLGDSITEGVGASSNEYCYVERVKRALNCETVNLGISGTRIAKRRIPYEFDAPYKDFQTRAGHIDADANLLVVFGGVNDFWHGDAPLESEDEYDSYSFRGGVKNLCRTLLGKYPPDRLLFITPLGMSPDVTPRVDEVRLSGVTLDDYVNIILEETARLSIPCLNLYKAMELPAISATSNEMFVDEAHPNDAGHAWIAERITEYVMANMDKLAP